MFERIDYYVLRIDGDYAYESVEEKCVARALLPASVDVGTKLSYEMMQYEIID